MCVDMYKSERIRLRAILLTSCSCVLAVSLLALIAGNVFLLFKVFDLEERIHHLENSEKKIIDDYSEYQHFADADINETSNDVTLTRIRRSSGSSRSPSARRRIYGCHLVGRPPLSTTYSDLTYFVWSDQSEKSSCIMSTETVSDPTSHSFGIRSIRITQNGFYLVYAQMTFEGSGDRITSFKVIKTSRRHNENICLLRALKKQERAPPNNRPNNYMKDSVYQSGYFYLKSGESIQVLPSGTTSQFFDYRKDCTYFGVIRLH